MIRTGYVGAAGTSGFFFINIIIQKAKNPYNPGMPILGVLNKAKVPVKIWSPILEVESEALTQLTNIANLPFVFKHIAVMPDVHLGKGATVGSVIAGKGAISPAAVGVDIGCGMMAVKTELNHKAVCDKLPELRASIERGIPVGQDSNDFNKLARSVEDWKGWETAPEFVMNDEYRGKKAKSQLGSLGGGNHFIEICLDADSNVWVMLHSGSRYAGKELAMKHMNAAKGLMKQMFIGLPDPDLAYLPEGTEQFKEYLKDLNWAQDYAYQNRIEMMNRAMKDLAHMFNNGEPLKRLLEVNCHHNYVSKEHHYGENVLITRKGAVRAREGEYGIIPGSMGTRSYIVKGRGNLESYCSCSHGAGRKMSRTAAKKHFTLADFAEQTKGVECRKDEGVLDEIPGAYKDIDQVMENQKDLVEVVAVLKQVLCIKG